MSRLKSLPKRFIYEAFFNWRRLFRNLYWKIAIAFLLLLLGLAIAQAWRWQYLADRSSQLLNLGMARKLAEKFQPALTREIDDTELNRILYEMHTLYEGVEIYILDNEGEIIAYFGSPRDILKRKINLAPILQSINEKSPIDLPIYAEDPKGLDRKVIFSAASVWVGEEQGYLYIVLNSGHQREMRNEVVSGFTSGSALIELLLIIGITAIIGLIFFFFLTRRFHLMTQVVESFRSGDFSIRVRASSDDEVGDLGRAFNEMADTIRENIALLKDKDNQRRQLIANIAHDLRTPLVSIIGYLEIVIMQNEELKSESRLSYLESGLDSAHTLQQLIADLFELAKLEAKEEMPSLANFSLNALVKQVESSFKPLADRQGVLLESIFQAGEVETYADLRMIERVLGNLVSNAIRYTAKDGKVSMLVSQEGDRLLISIKDTGSGISKEDLPFIFDRFYQVDSTPTKKKGGSGLGLAIVKKIIESHNSEIYAESQLGIGTTFSFYLPSFSAG